MNRIAKIGASMAVVLCAICQTLAAPTPKQVSSYEKKMFSHSGDLIEIAKGLKDSAATLDYEVATALMNIAEKYQIHLAHIQDLLTIDGVVLNDDDKRRVKP